MEFARETFLRTDAVEKNGDTFYGDKSQQGNGPVLTSDNPPAGILTPEDYREVCRPLRDPAGKIMTTGKLAELAKVSARTAAAWVDRGLIKSYRVPSANATRGDTHKGDRRIYVDDAVRFLREHGMPLGEFGPVEHHACLLGDRVPIPSTHPFRVGVLARQGVLGNYLTGVGNDGFRAAVELARLVAEYSPTSRLGVLLSEDISPGALPPDLFDAVFEHHEPAARWLAGTHPFRPRKRS